MSDVKKDKTKYYYFENGFMVFTEAYHLKRGYCCNNDCRHCPFRKKSESGEEHESASGRK